MPGHVILFIKGLKNGEYLSPGIYRGKSVITENPDRREAYFEAEETRREKRDHEYGPTNVYAIPRNALFPYVVFPHELAEFIVCEEGGAKELFAVFFTKTRIVVDAAEMTPEGIYDSILVITEASSTRDALGRAKDCARIGRDFYEKGDARAAVLPLGILGQYKIAEYGGEPAERGLFSERFPDV